MTNMTVRVYPIENKKQQAIALIDGTYCYGEGNTVGEALSSLGYYLMSKEPPAQDANQTLMQLVLDQEQKPHEVRTGRRYSPYS